MLLVYIREVYVLDLEEIKSMFYIIIVLYKSFLYLFWEMIVLFFWL